MLAANVQCAGVGGDCRSQTGGGGGRLVFNPAHHQLQQVCEGQLKLHRCNAMWARPHVELGWAAVGLRLRAPPRLRPLVPVDFSPLRRGALWPERLNPQVLWQMKEQEGRQQPGELWSLLGPRLQGSPPLRHCAQVLSVSSWWWWPEQLSVGELRSNWTQIGAITPPKNATHSYTTLYHAAVYPCSKTVELLSNFLKKKKKLPERENKRAHLPFSSGKVLFYLCAHVFLDVLIWGCTTRDPVAQNRRNTTSQQRFTLSLPSCATGCYTQYNSICCLFYRLANFSKDKLTFKDHFYLGLASGIWHWQSICVHRLDVWNINKQW